MKFEVSTMFWSSRGLKWFIWLDISLTRTFNPHANHHVVVLFHCSFERSKNKFVKTTGLNYSICQIPLIICSLVTHWVFFFTRIFKVEALPEKKSGRCFYGFRKFEEVSVKLITSLRRLVNTTVIQVLFSQLTFAMWYGLL